MALFGGTVEEYLLYLGRTDVSELWAWDLSSNIRATAGISCVLKKNGVDQRKLVMQCAANYMFADPTSRADLGMSGGSAISRCFVLDDNVAVSACDEDSAFTHVRVPTWMSYWQAGPPVLAKTAWHLLPQTLQQQIDDPNKVFVAPRYLRLAMGGSHSVYILMRINLHHVGKTLFSYANKILNKDHPDNKEKLDDDHREVHEQEVSDEDVGIGDLDWELRQKARRLGKQVGQGYTVEAWCEAVRRSKQEDDRVFIVVHMFAGERRPGDIQEFLEAKMKHAGLKLLMLSVDLAEDPLWDFRNPSTVHAMMELATEGLIDVWLGGPPCSTVARSRHVPLAGGPRPLRFRWCLWGRPDLKLYERERVDEANDLWINFWMLCDAVSARGGAYLLEHPADPGCEPYPSMWLIPELLAMERRAGASRVHLHQCAFGGISPKLTTLSGNVKGMSAVDGVRCPGESADHVHGKSIGRAPDGSFYTRRLQTYPPALCDAMANMIFQTLWEMAIHHTGPTGALTTEHDVAAPRITAWSLWSNSVRPGVVVLNEAASRFQSLVVDKMQSAAYVHVDDTVLLSSGLDYELHSDKLLDQTVQGLEAIGFGVTQQVRSQDIEKVVGYEVVASPAQFRLPLRKMALLRQALLEISGQGRVAVDTLCSLVGMWIFWKLATERVAKCPPCDISLHGRTRWTSSLLVGECENRGQSNGEADSPDGVTSG